MSNGTGNCPFCGQPRRWMVTDRNDTIPVLPDPVEGGDLVIREDGRVHVVGPNDVIPDGALRMQRHFCSRQPLLGVPDA